MEFLQYTYFLFDIIGCIAFGISGAMIAIRAKMDLTGVILLAFLTGDGGGTIRDIILNTKVFWTATPILILIPMISGFLFYWVYGSKYTRSRLFKQMLLFFDTAGLAAFTAGGASKALFLHQNWLVSIMMGTLTAVGGGLMRDMLAQKVPFILKSKFYLTPTLLGGAFYVTTHNVINPYFALGGCLIVVIALRYLAEHFNWQQPSKHRK